MKECRKLHTKQDWTDWMFAVLNPLKALYSEGGARLHLGETGATYPQVSIEMEAFSRPLWALVPYWLGGGTGFEEIYVKGLTNGASPSGPEYWGGFTDYDQRFVEMAAIASGLLFTPEKLWEPLSGQAREELAAWLYGINEYIVPECNWQFFRILVNAALKRLGCTYSEEKLAQGLDRIESYYLEDGWYRDGASNQKDYYVSFAMHYYGLLYAVSMEKEDPERCARYRERAELFAGDFLYWFDENGAALPFGRSLTYRFGQAAFWSAYVFAGLDGIPLGVVKGILTRHLAWWSEQKIYDRDGVLTIGYAYPNLVMAERYNAPGSPYWGLKTLLCLALPKEHPFWAAEEESLPALAKLKAVKPADMLLHRHGRDVIAYPAGVCEKVGHGHAAEKYSKFACSTRFGLSVAKSQLHLHENAPDSMLAFVVNDYVYVRRYSDSFEVREDRVISIWEPVRGIRVKTAIIPKEYGHMRIHEIQSDYDCMAYDCGFAVQRFVDGYSQQYGGKSAEVRNGKQLCSVSGEGPEAMGTVIEADPNTNLLYPDTAIPAVEYFVSGCALVRLETQVKTVIF